MDADRPTREFCAVDELLRDLAAHDVRLRLEGGKLGYDSPPGAFTDALKKRVRALRAQLLDHLTPKELSVAPLSCGQERMWYLNRLEVASAQAGGDYTEHLAYELIGVLDQAALNAALNAVIARHGTLRCRFRDGDDGPEQVLSPPAEITLDIHDLSAEPQRLNALMEQAAQRPIDLATDDHIRFALVVLGPEHHVLSLSTHHATWDGWSNTVFAADLAQAYNAARTGQAIDLPALIAQVAELAREQRQALAEHRFDPLLKRLAEKMAGFPTQLPLPTDHPRPAIADSAGANLEVRIPPDVASALAAAGRKANVTAAMTLMAAFALFLSRLSGAEKLLLGAPVAAREDEAAQAVIGYLANTMAIPVDVAAATSFGALAGQLRDTLLELMATQRVPFDKLVEVLAPKRSRATTPLVQAVFALQPGTTPAPALDGLRTRVLPHHNHTARYELMLNLEPTHDGGFEGPLTYATALFTAATAERWRDDFLSLLAELPYIWDQPLNRASPAREDGFSTDTERQIAAIWAEFLHTAPTSGADDFFMLGGHSLLLMRVINRINTSGLGQLNLVDALGASTVAAMAALLGGKTAEAPPVTPDCGQFPASFAQEGMFLARHDDPCAVTWAVPLVIDLAPHTPLEHVQAALLRLVARHPALRTTLSHQDGVVSQHIAAPAMPALDIRHNLDHQAQVAVMRAELARPMDLTQGPLYRFTLFADDDGAMALFVVADHSLIDGWSVGVLQRDFPALLAAVSAGRTDDDLPVLSTSPAAIAGQQRDMLAGPRGVELRRDWLAVLHGMDLGEGFAVGHRPPETARQGRRTMIELPAATVAALDQMAASHSTTPTVAFLAVVGALLARLKADGREIALGTPFAGRAQPESADLVGCFVELLPLRLACPADQTFTAHLATTRRTLLHALARQDYPLGRLSDDWLRACGGEMRPLYDAVAVVEDASPHIHDWFDPLLGAGKYDLAFVLSRLPDGTAMLTIEHDQWQLDQDDARALAARLQSLLADAAQRPTQALGELHLLPEAEHELVTTGFNRTETDYPADESMAALWSQAAARHATATALICADGRRLTYARLDQWADAIASHVRRQGGAAAAAPVIALAVERGPGAIAAILGLWKLGVAYLPLDAKMPPSLVAQLMDDAGALMIIGDGPGLERLDSLNQTTRLCLDDMAPDQGETVPAPATDGTSPAYVMFTSGTTGRPKGVMVPHRAIARLALGEPRLELSAGAVMGQGAPLAFDASTLELWLPLLNGAALRLLADEELHDPARFRTALRNDKVSALWLTAAQFNRMADEVPDALAPLRWVATGGETLSPPHLRRVAQACPDLVLLNGYGPTENTVFTTLHRIGAADLDGAIPIGTPLAATRVYIVDSRLQPLPVGCWGELLCAGDGLALGYAGRPDLTEAAFVTLAWAGERVYRSGDIARWRRDGVIEFMGRRDGQVKIRGHRIETAAIEAILADSPDLRDAAIVVTGEGAEKSLIACVVSSAGQNGRERELSWRRLLAERLPLYMMPARFLVLADLPRTNNGKRDRRALAALVADAMPAPTPVGTTPPASDNEKKVGSAFGQIFPDCAIDRHSDFFLLGGHSLLAMRLAALLEDQTGTRLTLRSVFAARTVAAIAGLLDKAEPVTVPTAIAAEEAADYPLSNGQERLWIMQRLFPDSPAYNVPLIFEAEGALDTEAFARALTGLEQRHHALRLRIVADADGSLRQRVMDVGQLRPHIIELSPDQAEQRMHQEWSRPFRLDQENGARVLLMRLGPSQWRVMMVLHHSLCDGWSVGVLLRDFAALYANALGQAIALAPAPTQFQHVAAWQRTWMDSGDGQAMLARWLDRLTPPPAALALVTDHPRPPTRSFAGATGQFVFAPATATGLESLARAQAVTPFALVTALVQTLLTRMTGQTDLALGTLVSGRDRPELADSVGFLVNTLVLRQNIDPSQSFQSLLAATAETCLQAVADQHCPFEALVERLAITRDPGRTPLFDVLVVWQDGGEAPPVLTGLTTRALPHAFPFAKFDLGFHFGRHGEDMVCQIEYCTDLFEARTIAALFARLEVLATAVLDDCTRPLSALTILPEAERRLVTQTFNATGRDLDTNHSLLHPFMKQVKAAAQRPALLWDGGCLDYAGLAAGAAAIAQRLVAAGVKPGDLVALCGQRSSSMLMAIYGVLASGAAYAPLGTDQPPARLAAMLEDLGQPLVLAEPDQHARLPGARLMPLSIGGTANAALDDLGGPQALAYVLFTSGSTGRPKGVAIEQHSVLNRLGWLQETLPIGPGDVVLQKTPLTFDVSVPELFWATANGAAIAVPPPGAERDPMALAAQILRHRVTHAHFVPSMLAAFLDCVEDGRIARQDLRSLRRVFASGEALPAALAARFDALLYGPLAIELHNFYGPTEATVDVSWHPCSPWNGAPVVPIGAPIANTSLYVLDSAGQPLPVGMEGEIHIGGCQVARNYVNRPDLTEEKFIADPFTLGGRLYRSGDRGRWRHDGRIEYLGRLDNQVKVRGQRIEPGEIEQGLESHPAIARAIVVVADSQGQTELHAYVQTRQPVATQALRTHLREKVTEAMVPAQWFVVDELPLTANGKLDRKALVGRRLDDTTSPAAAADAADSADTVRGHLRDCWRQVLPTAQPGDNDGFFEIGGNSLRLISLHELLEKRWPGCFSVTDLFACATIAQQAQRILGPVVAAQTPAPVAVPAPAVAPSAPAPSQAVAIVGMAIRLPGADTLDEFWRDVATGADRVGPLPAARQDDARRLTELMGLSAPEHFRPGGYLEDLFDFEPARLRLSPADAALLAPDQRLFLDTALRALEDGGRGGTALDEANVGVFVGGIGDSLWRDAMLRGAEPEQIERISTLNVASNMATRLSFLHDWRGPAALIDTACSSSLVALHQACRALRLGECDWALAGGAKVVLAPPAAAEELTIYSRDGRTHAFAEGADGTGIGEGAVVFLLRPLSAALAEGDAIHAVILGSAVNQDGASAGMAAPNPAAQAEVIKAAARDGGISLASLSYIEAHGTGTALGDPLEIDGLTRAFADFPAMAEPVAIGSGKGNYGHLDGAAGALGVARAVLCLTHDQAPPQPFFTQPNQRIDFANAPVAVAAKLAPLPRRDTPRRAGISAFGLSGINAHVILEAPPPPVLATEAPTTWMAIGLSAPDSANLRHYAAAVVESLRQAPHHGLAAIARSLTEGRTPLAARLAVAVRDRGDLMARLAVFAAAPEAAAGLVAQGMVEQVRESTWPVTAANEAAALAAARAFVEGAGLSWPAGHAAGRVHLPSAPLARRRLFPQIGTAPASPIAAASPVPPDGPVPPYGIEPSVPVWQPHPLPSGLVAPSAITVIGDGDLAQRLSAYLHQSGRLAEHCSEAAVTALPLLSIGSAQGPAVILAPAPGADCGHRTTAILRALRPGLSHPTTLLALGQGAFAIDDHQALDPDQALIHGVASAAMFEEKLLNCRYVDTDEATPAEDLVAELAALSAKMDDTPAAIAWRGSLRLRRRFVAVDRPGSSFAWPDRGCCVISGGTGGLSLLLAKSLSNNGQVALVLLSRSGVPAASPEQALLDQLRADGLRVDCFACDVSDRAALAATLTQVRRELGPITAIVHNAGLPDVLPLAGKLAPRADDYDALIAGKVEGARLLDELTAEDPLAAFVMAGSLAALIGGPGQGAYMGANAFLDAFAAWRRRQGRPALAIDWCMIHGLGMATRNPAAPRHLPGVNKASAGPMLLLALATDAAQVALLDPPVKKILTPPETASPPPPRHHDDLATRLAALWAKVLGYDRVRPEDDFYALGGDSISGMQIVEQANRDLGLDLTLADLFAAGTVAALAAFLHANGADTPGPSGPLVPAPRQKRYPLAWEQLAVLHAEAGADMGTAYNLPQGIHLPADVRMPDLIRALNQLVAGHEIMRTRLLPPISDGAEPAMEILPAAPVNLEHIDVIDALMLEPTLRDWVRPFPLWSGEAPVRMAVASINGRPCALALDIHHVFADAFTVELLLAQLNALYDGQAGAPAVLQIKDYAWWQRHDAEAMAARDTARTYWLDRFRGPLPHFDLPQARPRTEKRRWQAQYIETALPPGTMNKIRDAAGRWRVTPFTIMAAAWAALLSSDSASEQVVMAVPVDSRRLAGMKHMTGMLVGLLPLKLKIAATDTVAKLIRHTHDAHTQALRHASFDLGQLLAELAPSPQSNRPLLAEIQLSYLNFDESADWAATSSGLRPFFLHRPDGKSDINIYVRDLPEQMILVIEYAADLFDPALMQDLTERACRLLEALTTADDETTLQTLVAPRRETVLS